jgi:hydroxyethylthiazole kinase-like uncharacterized protein yjeF
MPESTDPTPVDAELLRSWSLPEPGESKYSRGDVLVVGGSRSTPGGAILAGVAALRSGAGRLTFAVAESVASAVAVAVPEAAVIGLAEDASGSVTSDAHARLEGPLDGADAVLIGPGLDDLDATKGLLAELLPRISDRAGVCLDAYALAALAELGDPARREFDRLVLTPNKEEAAVLNEGDVDDLPSAVRAIARRHRATVACYDIVADETGRAWRGIPGSAGLGTSGSGDVRAGIVSGLLARGATASQAATWGSHVHAAAGERLAARVGRLGYLARELAVEIPGVIDEIERGPHRSGRGGMER